MDSNDIWTLALIFFISVAVVMVGMAVFAGTTFSSYTWVKIGGAIFLAATGGYWFLKKR